jgi:23S rRNA (cytidine1920-2'-O)/16S rRNA (cytidine1409-2'-O)-methyltransferase
VAGALAADFGCHVGGFTDCLLQKGAARVYAVDTGYGVLAWRLRRDERVVVMERTNAMHVELPEPVDLVTCDVGWTRQVHILPNALRNVRPEGRVLSLFKPQYEAPGDLVREGVVAPEAFEAVLEGAMAELERLGIHVAQVVRLPHERESKNREAFLCMRAADCARPGGAE